jgi:hypothetical protein
MVHLPPLIHREGDEQAHRVKLSHQREDFVVVDVMSLRIALHHKTRLVLGHNPVLILLHVVHPLYPDQLATRWEIEGPEKATRGGVNERQSNFLNGTWPMS